MQVFRTEKDLLCESRNQTFNLHGIGEAILNLPRVEPSLNSKTNKVVGYHWPTCFEFKYSESHTIYPLNTHWSLSTMLRYLRRRFANHSTPTRTFQPGKLNCCEIGCGL